MYRFRGSRPWGSSSLTLLAALAVVVAIPLLAWRFSSRMLGFEAKALPLMVTVERADYEHIVLTRGTLESSVNAEVVNEVDSSGYSSGGPRWYPTILEVVPEGTLVEPGDFLVKLDVKYHEDMVRKYEKYLQKGLAYRAIAESRLEAARTELEEYRDGKYPYLQELRDQKVFNAEEDLRTASEAYEFSKQLIGEGIITEQQLEADRFAMRRAEKKLEQAKVSADVLKRYTRERTICEMEGEIAAAESYLAMRTRLVATYEKWLEHYQDQVSKAILTAPVAGQVVYNNLDHGDHWHMIAQGETVYGDRVVIRLPDPTRMQVKALVQEEDVNDVEEGMRTTIELDAFPGVALTGEVTKVNELPEAETFWSASIKQFEITVVIDSDSVKRGNVQLRPGLTADVHVFSEERDSQVQVPFQAIVAHGKKRFCLTIEDGKWEAREVRLGPPSNGSFVIVEEGLAEGQSVVLAGEAHRNEIEWPDLPQEEKEQRPGQQGGAAAMARKASQQPIQPQQASAVERDA